MSNPFNDEEGWIDISNGDYRAIVTAINWWDEPEYQDNSGLQSDLPSFVLQLNRVDSIEAVKPPLHLPDMRDPSSAYAVPDCQEYSDEPIQDGCFYRAFQNSKYILTPGSSQFIRVDISVEEFNKIWQSAEEYDYFLLTGDLSSSKTGVLCMNCGAQGSGNKYSVALRGYKVVRVVESILKEDAQWVRVSEIVREASEVPEERARYIKLLFEKYAKLNDWYASHIPYPEYTAERLLSLECAEYLTSELMDLIDMPADVKLSVLEKADSERLTEIERYLS